MTFILRFFHFRIIREFLNSRASICVVGNFREIMIGTLRISIVVKYDYRKLISKLLLIHKNYSYLFENQKLKCCNYRLEFSMSPSSK